MYVCLSVPELVSVHVWEFECVYALHLCVLATPLHLLESSLNIRLEKTLREDLITQFHFIFLSSKLCVEF